jgi:hypothetical protein
VSLAKRIIPCLDVHAGRVVKGVNFVALRDAGDPVEAARTYDAAGADEITFLDITAERRARHHRRDRAGRRPCLHPAHRGRWRARQKTSVGFARCRQGTSTPPDDLISWPAPRRACSRRSHDRRALARSWQVHPAACAGPMSNGRVK